MNNFNEDHEILTGEGNEFAADVSNYTPPPSGNHLGRCVGLIQLGTQSGDYQGKPGKDRRKIMMLWELPEALHVFYEDKGPQPFIVSQIYSLVVSDKSTYTIHMQGWTGGRINRDFNPLILLGKPCNLSIIHKPSAADPERIRAKVVSISGLTKNATCPEQITPTSVLLFSKWNENLFNEQNDWIKKTIEASPEYRAMKESSPLTNGNREGQFVKKPVGEDGLPF